MIIYTEILDELLKYECVYLRAWETGSQAKAGIGRWITFYNHQRHHAAHGDQPPADHHRLSAGRADDLPDKFIAMLALL